MLLELEEYFWKREYSLLIYLVYVSDFHRNFFEVGSNLDLDVFSLSKKQTNHMVDTVYL